MIRPVLTCACALAFATGSVVDAADAPSSFAYRYADTYDELCGVQDEDDGCAEISAYDPRTGRVFTTNGTDNALRVLHIDAHGTIRDVARVPLDAYGAAPNSVAAFEGEVAVAMEAADKQAPGRVVLFDAHSLDVSATLSAGPLPDMLTYTPDGRHLLVANEGEPNDDYDVDPEGSITIIDTHDLTVRTADFSAFNVLGDPSVRIFGPGATVAQDLEPEYVAVSADSTTAWISLQENNAFAVLDIATAQISSVVGLGFKDHAVPGNGFDASDRDGGSDCRRVLEDPQQCIRIAPQPTLGMYQPDAIATFHAAGDTYIVSANEGDARDYDGFSEEARVGDDAFTLDASAGDGRALKDDAALGRLKTTLVTGDADGDGDIDRIYSYGARSFSIWDAYGKLVFDSGDDFEQRLAALQADGLDVWTDDRSDDKGPEPESVTIGSLGGMSVAFIGLERVSGVFAYDVSRPSSPAYLGYIDTKRAGDVSPEGLVYVPDTENRGVLIVTNEVSNTTSTYRISVSDRNGDARVDAQPTVAEGTIRWQSDDYYQVQSTGDYRVICEGARLRECSVMPGEYNVINLTTGQRFESVRVAG